jgi:Cu-processing system permease protein
MDTKNILWIMRKEAAESLKNRWFIIYTVCFSALALLVLLIATSDSNIAGFTGYGRTAASLINLVLLFVPLIALITGGISISSERESGTLSYLLSHPVTSIGVALKGEGGDVSNYLVTVLLSAMLAASLLSVGFIVSVYSSKASKAIGICVFLWLLFIVLGDLGIMGTAAVMDLGIKQVLVLALLNPAEVFKIASVLVLSPRFEILGPVGVYAVRTFGKEGIFYLLFFIMALWTLVPLAFAYTAFSRFRKEEL